MDGTACMALLAFGRLVVTKPVKGSHGYGIEAFLVSLFPLLFSAPV
jgi:hypothetical protein